MRAAATAPVAVPQTAPVSVSDELRKLADLRREGILTEEEFAAQKAKLQEFAELCGTRENPVGQTIFDKAKNLFQ